MDALPVVAEQGVFSVHEFRTWSSSAGNRKAAKRATFLKNAHKFPPLL
jgi:hypothetical protein